MKYLLIIILLIFSQTLWTQNCDKVDMVTELHKLTVTDATYPVLSTADVQCITNTSLGIPLSYPCVNNTGGSYGLMSYYDINGNGEVDGVTPSNVTTFDGILLTNFLNQTDYASKLAATSSMAHLNRTYHRRRCDGSLPANCTSDQVLIDMHDFNDNGSIDNGDIECLQQVILTGGGAPFHIANPDCARTDDLLKDYNVGYYRYNKHTTSTISITSLQAYLLGLISSYDDTLANVKIVTDLHGCTPVTLTPPDALALSINPTQTTYNGFTGDTFEIDLSHSGGTGARTLSFSSNIADPNMTIETGAPDQFVFKPDTAGVYIVDLRVTDGASTVVTEQVTFNISNPVPSGSAPQFFFATPWDNWTFVVYLKGGSAATSMRGSDADGAADVVLSTEDPSDPTSSGLPSGVYVSTSAHNPAQPNNFNGYLNFSRHPSTAGDFTFHMVAKDSTHNVTKKTNLRYIGLPWFENLRDADNNPVSLSFFSEGAEMGEDVPGSLQVGETYTMRVHLPPPPFDGLANERPWSHSKVTSSILGSSCPDTAGATYVADPVNEDTGLLTFTPTSVGQQIVCIRSTVDQMSSSRWISGMTEHRLRFNVTADPAPPALTMTLSPAQTSYAIQLGDSVQIGVQAGGGVPNGGPAPFYTYGWDNYNQAPANMNASLNFNATDRYIRFTPQTTGTHTFVIFAIDSDVTPQRVSRTITLNVTSPPTVGSAPVIEDILIHEGMTVYLYRSNTNQTFFFHGFENDGGDSVTVSGIDSAVVSDDWPSGTSFSKNGTCSGGASRFCWNLVIPTHVGNVGTWNMAVKAEDDEGNQDFVNFTTVISPFTENFRDPSNGDQILSKNFYNELGVQGYDIPGNFEVNQQIMIDLELPTAPAGENWNFSLVNSANGTPCSNAAGATFQVSGSHPNRGTLTYTPTATGQIEICVQGLLNAHTPPSTLAIGNSTHRWRFDVQPAASTLALALDPNQTSFSATVSEPLLIGMFPSGGQPPYSLGFENISGGPSTQSIVAAAHDSFRFVPQASATYSADLYVTDSLGAKVTRTITINSSNLQIAFQNAVDPANPISWQRSNDTYWNNLIISGGIGDVADYNFVVNALTVEVAGGHGAGVVAGNPPVFKFQPDTGADYGASGGLFHFQVVVTDTMGNSQSTEIAFNVTNSLQCADGFYQATPTLCCRNDEVLDPTRQFCVNSMNTMALVDKQDFFSETGSANFPSMCKLDNPNSYLGLEHNVSNTISFSLDPQAPQGFGAVCRRLAAWYDNYAIYAMGGDLTTGITQDDPSFTGQIDTNLTNYDPNESESNEQLDDQIDADSLCDPGMDPLLCAELMERYYDIGVLDFQLDFETVISQTGGGN